MRSGATPWAAKGCFLVRCQRHIDMTHRRSGSKGVTQASQAVIGLDG